MIKNNCKTNLVQTYLKGQPSHPQCSSDWRFLPGVPGEGKALIITEGQHDFALPLCANFNPLVLMKQQLDPSAASKEYVNQISDALVCLQADLLHAPFPSGSFDLVAVPYGFPGGQTKTGRRLQEGYIRAAYSLTKPGGILYLGFANRWDFHRIYTGCFRSKPSSSLRRISRLFKSVGCESVTFYGAIQDHKIPLYIFPLRSNTVGFVVCRHYGRKLPGFLADLLPKSFISLWLRYLLPSYSVVARTK